MGCLLPRYALDCQLPDYHTPALPKFQQTSAIEYTIKMTSFWVESMEHPVQQSSSIENREKEMTTPSTPIMATWEEIEWMPRSASRRQDTQFPAVGFTLDN
ncbi:hypothetical protein KQX54_004664 [Cotesia glomerata]|uniref:Uncharacterized protein n=1 Tax=Cotesia glomerata TaxID=32391 RepID=A0AAV7IEW8_COTGL|nr:hypothetical protein KQX54_004664 [Cotesia glomerata]